MSDAFPEASAPEAAARTAEQESGNISVSLIVNGQTRTIMVEPRMTLLEALRGDLGIPPEKITSVGDSDASSTRWCLSLKLLWRPKDAVLCDAARTAALAMMLFVSQPLHQISDDDSGATSSKIGGAVSIAELLSQQLIDAAESRLSSGRCVYCGFSASSRKDDPLHLNIGWVAFPQRGIFDHRLFQFEFRAVILRPERDRNRTALLVSPLARSGSS